MARRSLKSRSDAAHTTQSPTATPQAPPKVDVSTIVTGVIDDIRSHGDAAVRKYSEKFDKWSPPSFKLSPEEIDKIIGGIDKQIIDDIKTVQANVRKFAQHQREAIRDFEVETQPGVFLGQKNVPIQSVGTYVFRCLASIPRWRTDT